MISNICEKPVVKKLRYLINFQGSIWEVDEFLEENEGLVVAEIELKSENEIFNKPDWIGKEVSDDPKYFNSNLIRSPFRHWNL
ncbi:hypothetical protein LEP1GSC061_0998 [Leptospira wolffii serovar Khorat str. Khorat-H2]|nr:hypothetical protein LEP1GSC061_0998 [Leptospira wolffii serovar Khorat str. Khorat-H2]